MKESRLAFTKYVAGEPLERTDILHLKNGLPFWIQTIDKSITSRTISDLEFRMWHTLLSVSRVFTSKPVLDTSSITTPSNNNNQLITDYEIKGAASELKVSSFWWT